MTELQTKSPDDNLRIDPITQEIITEGLSATMAEMRVNVMRAAYSAVIALVQDFSCGLFNPQAELIAQGPDHPGHIVPLPWGVRACMEDLGDTLRPGDIVLLNDPYRGGTHLNDVTVLQPVFLDGELFCFPAVRAHWADVGGISPGSYSGEATNIFYEGVRIPPLKIYDEGRLNEAVFKLMMSNMRLPEERHGDFLACIGACRTGERRVLEMVEKYGKETFLNAVEANLNRAEKRMRSRIGSLPDGEFFAEDYVEFFTDGRLDPGLVSLRLEVSGEEMVADFTSSSPQLPGVVNSTAAVALAGVVIAIKSAVDPSGAINGGTFRPIECRTNAKSIVNVEYDAPANAHGEIRKRVVGVTLAALAQAAPELVSGDLCGTSFPNAFGGWDNLREKPFVYLAALSGGNGGFVDGDGPSAFANVDFGNLPTNWPSEEMESIFPVVIEEIAMRPDSEGAGRRRGGLGAVQRVRLLAESAEYSLTCDRAVIPPWGTLGGEAASPIFNDMRGADHVSFHLGKVSSYPMTAGDVLTMRAAGGGGYGDPLERDVSLVVDDVADGYITPERAYEAYGVVLDAKGVPDLEETTSRRTELASRRQHLRLAGTSEDCYVGKRGRHRIQRLNPNWIDRLGITEGDLLELVSPNGAALRAWARFDSNVPDNELALDPMGLQLLGLVAGDSVSLRVPLTINDANDLSVREGRVRPLGDQEREE